MKQTLKQARVGKKITQVEMARILNMTEKTYIAYEKGDRIFRMDKADEFAKAVSLNIDDIIFFETELQKFCTKELMHS